MADVDLGSMFDSIDFSLPETPVQPKAKETEAARPAPRSQETPRMGTIRAADMLGDLDSMLADLDKGPVWEPKYAVGDEVEAVYDEDELWYLARIDAVELDVERYVITFVDYGNEQITCEENIRWTLQRRMEEDEKALAAAVQTSVLEKKKRRQSLLVHHPELVARPTLDKTPPASPAEKRKQILDEKKAAKAAQKDANEKEEDDSLAEALASGVLTPEQRKALILKEAMKLSKNSAERTFIKAGGEVDAPPSPALHKAQSDRYLENLRKNDKKVSRARSASVIDTRLAVAGASSGIFGDMEALVRQRADSESAINPESKTPETKIWSKNALAK